MLSSFRKNKKSPKLWAMNPELYPNVISNFRAMKNLLIRYNEKNMKIFLITGSERKTGVSTVAFNLSLICGWDMPEHRILIIDANVSSPMLHESFSIKNVPGLTDFLYGKVSLNEIIYKSDIENLDLIPFGEKNETLPSPFTRSIFLNFVDSMRNRYDFIIVDSEPSITSGYTQSILKNTDAVILVVKNSITRLESIAEFNTQMYSNGIPIIGTFLNFRKKSIPNFILKYI